MFLFYESVSLQILVTISAMKVLQFLANRLNSLCIREYWMIIEDQAFSVVWFGFPHHQFMGGGGQIIRRRDSLVL
jgi:hypothetical protein